MTTRSNPTTVPLAIDSVAAPDTGPRDRGARFPPATTVVAEQRATLSRAMASVPSEDEYEDSFEADEPSPAHRRKSAASAADEYDDDDFEADEPSPSKPPEAKAVSTTARIAAGNMTPAVAESKAASSGTTAGATAKATAAGAKATVAGSSPARCAAGSNANTPQRTSSAVHRTVSPVVAAARRAHEVAAGPAWTEINFDEEIELGAQIGGGGFALVYEGKWRGRRVALKTLFDPRVTEDVKREYMDELLVMAQLSHPNIVTLLGACVKPPNMCMVLELCDRSLHQLLHASRIRVEPRAMVLLAADVARGMAYLHAQTPIVVHRDLKTHNLLLTPPVRARGGVPAVKVCDFGLVSNRATCAGTPAYMAPELLQNAHCFSASVDVYAFGVVLWEMMTRTVPFATFGPAEIRDHVRVGKRLPLPMSDCPREVRAMITRCWDGDARKRPTFADVEAELVAVHKAMPTTTALRELSLGRGGGGGGGDALDMLGAAVRKK